MVNGTVEERLSALENEVERLRERMEKAPTAHSQREEYPWWKRFVGVFADTPAFEDAVRHGEAWRNADRPGPNEETDGGEVRQAA